MLAGWAELQEADVCTLWVPFMAQLSQGGGGSSEGASLEGVPVLIRSWG